MSRTTAQVRVRAALLLLVAGFLLHEALIYARITLHVNQFALFPAGATLDDGTAEYWQRTYDRNLNTWSYRFLDEERRGTAWLAPTSPRVQSFLTRIAAYQPFGGSFYATTFEDALSLRGTYFWNPWRSTQRGGFSAAAITAGTVNQLNTLEYFRAAPARRNRPTVGDGRHVVWSYEGGRFVARTPDMTSVLGSWGPDGLASTTDGASFDGLALSLVVHQDRSGRQVTGGRVMLVDRDTGEWFAAALSGDPGADGDVLPVVSAGRVAQFEPGLEVIGQTGRKHGLLLRGAGRVVLADLSGETSAVTVAADPAAVRPAGLSHHADTTGRPRNASVTGLVTELGPLHPTRWVQRHDLLGPDESVRTTRVSIEPVSGAEHALWATYGALALLRPAPCNVAAFVFDGPMDYEAYFRRGFRDPFLGSRSEPMWLGASILLAMACGLLARRAVRRQLGSTRAGRLWVTFAAALGPLGLAWMRLLMPRDAVVPCDGCGARRGVRLDVCMACGAGWPVAPLTGCEVFA